MVEHTIGMPALEAEWSQWCTNYLRMLIAVPGIQSIQRFRVSGSSPSRYMSMHTVDSAQVFDSAPYKASGGGGRASERFRPAYQSWRRNLFEAAMPAPMVGEGQVLLVRDSKAPDGAPFTWIRVAGLDRSTPYRGLAVMAAADAAGIAAASPADTVIYSPLAPQWTKGNT